eukprot:6063706-Pyramimonas_sp.AAC.1
MVLDGSRWFFVVSSNCERKDNSGAPLAHPLALAALQQTRPFCNADRQFSPFSFSPTLHPWMSTFRREPSTCCAAF